MRYLYLKKKYIKEILEKFKISSCNRLTPIATGMKQSREENGDFVDSTLFKSLVSSLGYLMITTPDIVYGIGLVSRYIETPKESHWLVAKRILRHIKRILNLDLFYAYSEGAKLVGNSDSERGGDMRGQAQLTMSSILGHLFSWTSKKKGVVVLSSCEVEYVAPSSTVCKAIWLWNILKELDHPQEEDTVRFVDNKSAIQIEKNPVHHGSSKHIDT